MKCDKLESFIVLYNGVFIRAYRESDVDESIAELKDEIKRKEGVGQRWFDRCMEARKENAELKDTIGKLLNTKTEQVMDEVFQKCLIYGEGFVPVEHAMKLVAELRHNKYKRCLAMKEYCASELELAFRNTCISESVRGCVFFRRWLNKWLELADKLKEV